MGHIALDNCEIADMSQNIWHSTNQFTLMDSHEI